MPKLKFQKKNKILIVAAHPDDEMLGCGGTILKLKNKCDIHVMFMTDGVSSRGKNNSEKKKRRNSCINLFKKLDLNNPIFLNFPDNQMDKIPLLKIIKKVETILNKIKPETVITHYSECLNIDHRLTYQAVMTACRPLKESSVKKILSFEVLSSTEWAKFKNKSFDPNYYIDISKNFKNKLSALKFYKKELRKYPHSRSLVAVEALAKYRGVSSGVKYAEAFYLNRFIDK